MLVVFLYNLDVRQGLCPSPYNRRCDIKKSACDDDSSNNGSIHSCCIQFSCAAATRYTEPTVTNDN